MATYNIVCEGPGPHDPPDGVLGTTSVQGAKGMRCRSAACALAPDSAAVNGELVKQRARLALAANAQFLAAAKPGTAAAQASAAYDQAVKLTKECTGVIRQLYGLLEDISDT